GACQFFSIDREYGRMPPIVPAVTVGPIELGLPEVRGRPDLERTVHGGLDDPEEGPVCPVYHPERHRVPAKLYSLPKLRVLCPHPVVGLMHLLESRFVSLIPKNDD